MTYDSRALCNEFKCPHLECSMEGTFCKAKDGCRVEEIIFCPEGNWMIAKADRRKYFNEILKRNRESGAQSSERVR